MARVATAKKKAVQLKPAATMPDARERRIPQWLRARYVITVLLLLYAGYRYFFVMMPEYHAVATKQAELQKTLSTLQAQNKALKEQMKDFQNDDYIREYARTHFDLVPQNSVSFTTRK